MLMVYRGMTGEHVSMSAKNAIELAAKHNRKVRMRFNGIALTVNKRLSVKHVVGTWRHMLDASRLRYQNSPEGIAAKAKRAAEIVAKQSQLDALMMDLPASKEVAAAWIAKWVPLSDDVRVNRRGPIVAEALRSIGFVSGQHVGAPELKSGTPPPMMRIEYIAGQVILMLESVRCVPPVIGRWAAESAAKSRGGVNMPNLVGENVMSASGQSIVLPKDVPFEIVTGEVTKDGVFILSEEGTDSLQLGWWDERRNDWTIEPREDGYDVGQLTPLAKIIRR